MASGIIDSTNITPAILEVSFKTSWQPANM